MVAVDIDEFEDEATIEISEAIAYKLSQTLVRVVYFRVIRLQVYQSFRHN